MSNIPNNIIVKSLYWLSYQNFSPNYSQRIIHDLMDLILNTDPLYYDKIEIEAKLGHFLFFDSFYAMQSISETFWIPEPILVKDKNKKEKPQFRFESCLPVDNFYLIWNAVEMESKIPNSMIQKLGCFTYSETHYVSGKRRSIIFKDGKFLKEEVIKKENKKHFNVRNFDKDFRVTFSIEMENDIKDQDIVEMKREKFRTSYSFSFFEIDFTIATSSKSDKPSYEIEIEIKQLWLLLKNGKISNDEAVNVLNRFIQNVLTLYSATSNESIYIKNAELHKNQKKFGNIFGNYWENNINNDKSSMK